MNVQGTYPVQRCVVEEFEEVTPSVVQIDWAFQIGQCADHESRNCKADQTDS